MAHPDDDASPPPRAAAAGPWVAPPAAGWAHRRPTPRITMRSVLVGIVALAIVGAGVGATMRGLTGLHDRTTGADGSTFRTLGEPVPDGDGVIVSTIDRFVAFEADGSTPRWQGEPCAGARPAGLFPRPVDGRLVVTCDGALRELRTADGTLGWTAVTPGSVYAVRASARAVAVLHPRRLDVLDPATGVVRWQRARASEPTAVDAVDDLVLVREGAGLTALDAATGSVRWTAPLTPAWVTGADGRAWVRTDSGSLAALDLADGTVRWQTPADPDRLSWAAVVGVTGGTVVVQDTLHGRVFGYATGDGSLRWSVDTLTDPPVPLVAVADGHVAVADGNGVAVLDPATGAPLFATKAVTPERPALARGTVTWVDESDGPPHLVVEDLPDR